LESKTVTGDLSTLISFLEPLTAPPQRTLLIPTRSCWTAYFDNFVHGTDAYGPIGHLSDVMNCRGLILTCALGAPPAASSEKRDFDTVQFELYGPGSRDPLGCLRSISVARDGGPSNFHSSGSPLPFENLANYERRSVAQRFTPTMLADYSLAIGIDAFSEPFYGNRAELIAYANAPPARHCSVADMRREYGLE
jgi:hypothetical protein